MCSHLEHLYLERAATLAEMLDWRKTGSAPYQPKCAAFMHNVPVGGLSYECGHNPVLIAYKVQNLTAPDEHELAWEEPGVEHRSDVCHRFFGVPNCTEAERGLVVISKRWRSTTD
jgi:hypothetical protein